MYKGEGRELTVNDQQLVQLYWERKEAAITESSAKYGGYCSTIAYNILRTAPDTEECVNDTWLHAWNAMPPHKPLLLGAFLGKITRNLAFDRYKSLHREKRGGGSTALALDELGECVSGREDAEGQYAAKELMDEINKFLLTLPPEKRYAFVLRYWYADSIPDIAARLHLRENQVSVSLSRTRAKLKNYLTERGYDI